MKKIFYILILFGLFSCKSTKGVSEPAAKKLLLDFHKNGFLKSSGQIDTNYLSKAARIGLWYEFFENGKLKETGEYQTDSYTNCCIAGPCEIIYSYKIGEWNYYHENGQLRANGIYGIDTKHINTTCVGGDDISVGFINDRWKFYDTNGNETVPTDQEVRAMEKDGIVDEFDFMDK